MRYIRWNRCKATSPAAIAVVLLVAGVVVMNIRNVATVRAQSDAAGAAVEGAPPPAVLAAAQPAAAPAAEAADPLLERGLQLFARNCAACHGETGLGDGAAAYLLNPQPRNFAEGQFRVTSTKSGLPSDEDLLQVLRFGMPGSAMPAWGHLPEQDLRAMALAVRELAVRGKVQQLTAINKNMKPERALKTARSLLESGPPAELPPPVPQEKLDLNRGQALYAESCAACHDADGRGRNKRDLTDNAGQPIFARDFTQGIFKGGSDAQSLAMRIFRGMPGSPMPAATEMSAEDLWSLVAYVQTFIKPGAQERVVQAQQTLVVKRTDGALTIDPDDARWARAPVTFLPVMPLWWRDDRIEGVNVQMLHDGGRIAIRLEWLDSTANDTALQPQDFTDGVAIQLAPEGDPPLFAMGQPGAFVNIWHWKATKQRSADGDPASLAQQYANAPTDDWGEPDEPVYNQPAAAAGNIVAPSADAPAVECLIAGGFGTLTSRGPSAQLAQGGARRGADGWRVVFLHELGTEGSGDEAIALEPGTTLSIAFAVWDGAIGDRNGQKSVTIWHKLALEK